MSDPTTTGLSPTQPHVTAGTYDPDDARREVRRVKRDEADLIDRFEALWYHNPYTWATTHYLGRNIMKFPTDLWAYQEAIWETQPDLIIETGTAFGASALWFAHQLDHLGGRGGVLTVDITGPCWGDLPEHPRITFLRGSSTEAGIVETIRTVAAKAARVMVVLDSDHDANHVWDELEAYGGLVTPGCLLVVEDTNCHKPGVWANPDTGSLAVQHWLPHHPEYQIDHYWERFLVTMNPDSWLRRVR